MIRARFIVDGDVQKVGYRDFVQKVARKLGVKGYVENLPNGSVQIVCEAEEPVLKSFVENINVREGFIKVERISIIEKSEAKGEFEFFEIKYGRIEDELGERLGTAVTYASAMYDGMREMHNDIKGMREEMKEMHSDVSGTVKSMHMDLKETIVNMHNDLKNGIAGVQSEISGMRREINDRFEEMAKRYDTISAELVRTREELTKAVNALLKLIEEFIRERQEDRERRGK
ncbi:MAG: acylphosphatase [Candidatus Brockarchaeota archaeon]|nr:acylphosphatase [Candidatus Brockarchaeota archaeon]